MKQLLIAFCCICLFMTGCQNQQGQDTALVSEDDSVSVVEPPTADDFSEEAVHEPQGEPNGEPEPIRNQAVGKIKGLEGLPVDCAFGVKNYDLEMGWMEANAIANLARSAVEPGSYFLIVPQYAGSSVTVEPLRFEGGALVAGEAVYHIEECPDDYALIVNNTMPEASPDMRVTVTYGAVSGSYEFRYDGRGDTVYPVVQDGYYLVVALDEPMPEGQTEQDTSSQEGTEHKDSWEFVDGAGRSEPQLLNRGDIFGAWKVQSISAEVASGDLELLQLQAWFEGTVTLKGTVSISKNDLVGGQVTFTVADESLARMPTIPEDTRPVWLTFSNREEAIQMLGMKEGTKECEVVIKNYYYILKYSMVTNISELIAVK